MMLSKTYGPNRDICTALMLSFTYILMSPLMRSSIIENIRASRTSSSALNLHITHNNSKEPNIAENWTFPGHSAVQDGNDSMEIRDGHEWNKMSVWR